MLDEFLPWLPALIAGIAAVAAIWAALINRSGTTRARREPTWGELLARVGKLEETVEEMKQLDNKKMGAVLRILRAIASQWPTSSGPDLDPTDMALIEETIPPQWIRRSAPSKENE